MKKHWKVLVSAYACEPDKGSEPEVGWQWVIHLAQYCDVTVLTRSNNRSLIESKLGQNPTGQLKFVYMDLSAFKTILKKRIRPKFLGVNWYYSSWQKKAYKKLESMCDEEEYDLIHHLTFASSRLPFAVTGHDVPSIVGPVGGCEEFPAELFPKHGNGVRWKEGFRNWMTILHTRGGWGMRKYRSVDQVLASTEEMRSVFSKWGVKSILMPQIGMPNNNEVLPIRNIRGTQQQCKLLFVGGLMCWKGVELAVQAIKSLPSYVTLSFVGSGGDEKLLKKMVLSLKLEDRVLFLGRKSRAEVLMIYREYDIFFYPSLHDSGAFTVLEAMQSELPVICLNRGGPALSVISDCGIVVTCGNREETIEKLVEAVQFYLVHPEMLNQHGLAGRKRVNEVYSWGRKAEEMLEIYMQLLASSSGGYMGS